MDNKEFIDRINKAANIINEASRKSKGSYIMVSTIFINKLNELMRIEKLKKERKEKLNKIFNNDKS